MQRAANRIRVNAQLIDARTDSHLWAQTFDRDLADVFTIQSEVAQAIADQLRAKLSPAEKAAIEERPTADLVAYDLYVRANALIDEAFSGLDPKEMALEGVRLLDQAVARDPAFLLAYCKLADAHDQFYLQGLDHTASRLASAEAAVNAALRLGPDSGDAHLALAQHLYSNLDYDRARTELAIARRTLPNNPQVFALSGYVDRRQGRSVESARNLERALELDPRNVTTLQQVAFSYATLRAYPEETATWNRLLALKPGDFGARLGLVFVDFVWRADTRRLHAFIEALAAENPASMGGPLGGIRVYLALLDRDFAAAERAVTTMGDSMPMGNAIQVSRAFVQGLVAKMKGDAPAARAAFTAARATQEQIVRAQPDYGPTLCVLGLIDAALGRKDDALREGRRAMEVMPVAKDSLNGPDIISFFAVICAWTGEKDLAFQQLATAAQIPGGVVYGDLKLNPQWDSLRGDPRFDKIVASLAPKEITSK